MPKQATKSLSTTKKKSPSLNSQVPDKRTKNGKRIDIARIIELRDIKGNSFPDISKVMGYHESYIQRMYDKFKSLCENPDISNAYKDNRSNILNSIELKLLENLASEEKLKKASLNNVSYSFTQIHNARRLEEGKSTAGGVTVSITMAYNEAAKTSKDIRMRHAGTSSTADSDNNEDED